MGSALFLVFIGKHLEDRGKMEQGRASFALDKI